MSNSSKLFSLDQPTRPEIGMGLLGLSLIGFAAAWAVQGNFWQPVPELPLHTVWLYGLVASVILAAAGLLVPWTRRAAALVLTVVFLALAACFLPRVVSYFHLIGAWLGFAEHIAIAIGAAAVWVQTANKRSPAAVAVLRLVYAATALIFGLSHLLSLKETVALVPGWLPGSGAFWAIATGLAHLAVAVALAMDRLAVPASRMGALMYISFAVIVWGPVVAAKPHQAFGWACLALSLVLAGALCSLGDLLADCRVTGTSRLAGRSF